MFISINPAGMLTVINNLTERANAIDTEATNIRNSSEENHDPVPSVETATAYTPGFPTPPTTTAYQPGPLFPTSSTLRSYSQALNNLAEELRTRRQEAIDLNESGITMKNEDGTVSYYLPDPPEGTVDEEAYWNTMDTVTNVKAYNSQSAENGRAEAAELQEALDSDDGKSSEGRTIDEILAEMAKHQDIPAYGTAFVTTWTPEAYLKLAEKIGMKQREQNRDPYDGGIIGGIPSKDDKGSTPTFILGNLLASYSQSQNEKDASDKANAFAEAAIASDHSLMGELNNLLSTSDAHYDGDFIINLAERFELEPIITDNDPLAGVLNAMGNNPDAAIEYFMPDWEPPGKYTEPSPAAIDRWNRLENREWGMGGIDALSRGLAGASSLRPPSDSTIDERATWVTAKGVTLLAENSDQIHWSSTKRNIGILLGNCGPEVTGVATRSHIVPNSEEPYQTTPITINGGDETVLENSIARLLYEVSDSPDANYEIARGTTTYTAARASARNAVDGATVDEIKTTYDDQAEVMNLLTTLNSEHSNRVHDGAMAATSLLAAAPAPHISIPATVAGAGLTLQGQPSADATGHYGNASLMGAAYTNALNAGLINDLPDPESNPWYSVNENGGYEVTLETEEQVKSFYSWLKDDDGSNSEVTSELKEIGTEPESKPWTDAQDFKDAYGGKDW